MWHGAAWWDQHNLILAIRQDDLIDRDMYVDGKVVAFACDNSFFVKPSAAATKLVPELPQRPPYPGAKDYPVADELLDDSDLIRRLILETAALMPAPKPKKTATRRKSGKDAK